MRDDRPEEEDLDRLLSEGLRDLADDASEPAFLGASDEALLAMTSARVRARRHRRWFVLGGAVVAAFLLGFWSGSGTVGSGEVIQPEASPVREEVENQEVRPADPRDLETRATNLAASEKAAAFKEAGDRYLAEWGDVSGALRCYRQLCELLPAEDARRIEPGDSWLLVALKSDRSD